MKTAPFLAVFLLVFVTALGAQEPDPDVREIVVAPKPVTPHSEVARLVAENRHMVVPLPATTPFDADRGDRRAYLRAYKKGYRFTAATGWMSTCCLADDVRHREAMIKGQSAGQLAGLRAR